MGVTTTQGYRGKLVDKLTGTILDQFGDEDIKVSNNILQLFDLGEIPGTYTQQMTLPGTKKNNAYFEQYYDISIWNPDIFNTNQVVEAYLDFDSFYLVNGYLQLNKVNVLENKFIDSYEVTLFGLISNFSIDTRSSFLTDLSTLSAYNHTASYDNISASWQRNLFSGDIVYPMAEYGQQVYYSQIDFQGIDDNTSALVVQDYKPAIRIKKVWDAIFNQFGYTYTGSFWNQSFLDNVYLNCNNNLQTPVFFPNIEGYGAGRVTNVSGSAPITLTAAVSSSFIFNSVSSNVDGKFAIDGVYTKYTVDQRTTLDMTLDLAFQVSASGAAGSGMPAWYITWVNDSTGLVQDTQTLAGPINTYITTVRDSRTTTITETFNLKGVPVISATLPAGTYRIYIVYQVYGTNNFTVKLNPDANNLCALSINRVRQAGDQQVMDIPSNMPYGTAGIKVIDFIRSIQKKFNLIIYPSKVNPNQFIVETFNNWYKQGSIKNFNKYININDKITFTPANQLGYKKILFSDADDTDYIETLFKRTNNRIYGQSTFYDSGSYYSQGSLDVISDVIASGPLGQVPGSVYTGSINTVTGCSTYQINFGGESGTAAAYYTSCAGSPATQSMTPTTPNAWICAKTGTVTLHGSNISWTLQGNCSTPPTGSVSGSGNPMWIPYYISNDKYDPARVLPRLMFYNGLVTVSPYWIQGYYDSTQAIVVSNKQTQYPYFDNYSTGSLNGTSSIYPQLDSISLLYNNEQAVWGTTPTGSLVSEYWSKYLALLYNPRTRLVDASAVIGLADYFDLELNDIAEFRGNYYHLRAINDYNLTTGECNIQMLGPIIGDTISAILWPTTGSITGSCDFTYDASLVPMWSGSGIDYGSYLGGSGNHDINEMPNGQIVIAGNFGNYNNASTGSSLQEDLIIVNATGSLIRSASGALDTELYGGPNRSAVLSNDYLLITYAATASMQTGSILMASSSLSEYDSTFMANRGTGFNEQTIEEAAPSIVGNVDTHYIWTNQSNRYGSTNFASGSVVRIITNPTSSNRGSLDPTWKLPSTGSNIGISAIGVQSTGKVVLVGTGTASNFNILWAPTGSITGSYTVNGLARLNSDGTYDSTFITASVQAFSASNFGTPSRLSVNDVAIDSQDNIYIVGRFNYYQGSSVNSIVKLNPSGGLDSTFMTNIGTGPSTVGAPYLAAQSQSQTLQSVAIESGTDKVIVGGAFRSWNGTNVQGLTKLNSDGTLDTTFIPNNTATGSMGLPPGAVASQKGTFNTAGYGQNMDISFASNGDILVYGDFNNSGTDGTGTGSAADITNMTWNNVSASFGSTGFIPARILRITNSGSFPINGSYII